MNKKWYFQKCCPSTDPSQSKAYNSSTCIYCSYTKTINTDETKIRETNLHMS